VKITDFGLSKILTPTEKLFSPCGTLSYIAPEIIGGAGYGKEVDVWAIGVILYVMICHEQPFKKVDGND
jgi:serine/threonine protein kinase